MYNRDKIMQTLRNIKKEAEGIEPYLIIAQPRRNKNETAAQSFNGYGINHVNVMGHSFAFIDIEGEMVDVARNYLMERVIDDSKAKYFFFIGEDTVVPYDAFDILHSTAEANPGCIVAGVYYIKCSHPMISVKENNCIKVPNVDPGQVFEAWQTGMDAMLIPIDVLRRMRDEEPELPFCCIAKDVEDIPFVGEDNFFLHRTRVHGIKVLVNTNVQCLHMDLATGKYTAHPSVNLINYHTNITPTDVLTPNDKKFIDQRWFSRLPGGNNNTKDIWLPGQDIPDIIKDIADPVGLEIGTAEGITTKHLLSNIPTLKLYGVDPYPRYVDWDGNQPDAEENYKKYLENTEAYKDRLTHISKTSDDAVSDFEDESLDFIFIDGLHTYEQVLKDCKNYYPKLKKDGYFIGHDFTRIEGVYKAVTEFCKPLEKEVTGAKQDLWYIKK
jgi:hypothetical protein